MYISNHLVSHIYTTWTKSVTILKDANTCYGIYQNKSLILSFLLFVLLSLLYNKFGYDLYLKIV